MNKLTDPHPDFEFVEGTKLPNDLAVIIGAANAWAEDLVSREHTDENIAEADRIDAAIRRVLALFETVNAR